MTPSMIACPPTRILFCILDNKSDLFGNRKGRPEFYFWLAFSGIAFVFAVELFDASGGVNQFLFAGEERVANRTDFDFEIADRRTSLKSISASAGHGAEFIFGMEFGFHIFPLQGNSKMRGKFMTATVKYAN